MGMYRVLKDDLGLAAKNSIGYAKVSKIFSGHKKGSLKLMGCLFYALMIYISYFLNFFLPNTAIPKSPEPNKSMVAGSGTGEADGASTGSEFELVTVVVTKRLGSLALLELSSLQPKAPKIINTTHKNTNNFFI
jgi:hypothetical protein